MITWLVLPKYSPSKNCQLLNRDDSEDLNCLPAAGCASLDRKSLYEGLLADYQKLKHELTRQRARTGRYKCCWQKARTDLDSVCEELKRIRRVAKDSLALYKKNQRLKAC